MTGERRLSGGEESRHRADDRGRVQNLKKTSHQNRNHEQPNSISRSRSPRRRRSRSQSHGSPVTSESDGSESPSRHSRSRFPRRSRRPCSPSEGKSPGNESPVLRMKENAGANRSPTEQHNRTTTLYYYQKSVMDSENGAWGLLQASAGAWLIVPGSNGGGFDK